ncbi:methyltransferase family protein [Flavobacterium sp. UBA6135]|jgi:protein-S-isoprenylcysteine O-methyltransferase Ste14|uniref:Isoprenylcysteine carboxylmethyltransferase family protein n=1 Tax=Paenimyroides tangerinum TaxID=2488728 RepID=A0A3P3W474_9FLAO|nr:isoprenylcysteine carboxylmethyltransferase family protein [Flavobacterium sp. UBA6135]RRJ89208.1 isoprenylcysteine carboxylmethyltransferase family protein [Paenimyroides tangerinum]
MIDFLRIILPIYFIIYFGVAFVLKSVVVAKRIGKNPLVLPKDNSAYGLIGLYFKLTLIAMFIYVLAYAFFPTWHDNFLPIVQFNNQTVKYIGLTLLFISLVWTVIAQGHMKNSWRIGIDTDTKTELVTSGLFSVSRNPIFFGMILSLVGLFFTTPNTLTLIFLILGYVLIQIQIRLEEEFLTKEHGQAYIGYKQKVRRLI